MGWSMKEYSHEHWDRPDPDENNENQKIPWWVVVILITITVAIFVMWIMLALDPGFEGR